MRPQRRHTGGSVLREPDESVAKVRGFLVSTMGSTSHFTATCEVESSLTVAPAHYLLRPSPTLCTGASHAIPTDDDAKVIGRDRSRLGRAEDRPGTWEPAGRLRLTQ